MHDLLHMPTPYTASQSYIISPWQAHGTCYTITSPVIDVIIL